MSRLACTRLAFQGCWFPGLSGVVAGRYGAWWAWGLALFGQARADRYPGWPVFCKFPHLYGWPWPQASPPFLDMNWSIFPEGHSSKIQVMQLRYATPRGNATTVRSIGVMVPPAISNCCSGACKASDLVSCYTPMNSAFPTYVKSTPGNCLEVRALSEQSSAAGWPESRFLIAQTRLLPDYPPLWNA